MRRSTALMSVAAVAFMASTAFAQAKPDFAGTWNQVQDPNAAAAAGGGRGRGGGGGIGSPATITQDAKTLTIKTTRGANEITTVYNLDGSDSKNTPPGRGGAAGMVQVSHAKWDGAILVVTRSMDMNGTAMEFTTKFSLDTSGSLWVESIRPGQDGAPMSTKTQYKK